MMATWAGAALAAVMACSWAGSAEAFELTTSGTYLPGFTNGGFASSGGDFSISLTGPEDCTFGCSGQFTADFSFDGLVTKLLQVYGGVARSIRNPANYELAITSRASYFITPYYTFIAQYKADGAAVDYNRPIGGVFGIERAVFSSEDYNLNFKDSSAINPITTVPLPSSTFLFSAALLGLAGLGYAAKRRGSPQATRAVR